MKALEDSISRFAKAAGKKIEGALRPGAAAAAIDAVSAKLGTRLPASLAALYAKYDGEEPSSTLIDSAAREELAIQWESWSTGSFTVRFMTLEEVARAGTTGAWLDEDGECLRSPPEIPADGAASAETVLVPFVHVRAKRGKAKAGVSDDDWLIAVDTVREAVWLFEVGNRGLEGVFEEAPSLAAWLDRLSAELTKPVKPKEQAKPAAASALKADAPAILLVKFMLDRNLIELEEGATMEAVAEKIAPLLSLRPPKRAVRAVLDGLSEDDQIGEIFADDDLLAKVVIEFVD